MEKKPEIRNFNPMHEVCPPDWRNVPDVSGSYELDGVIQRSKNADLVNRLKMYACPGGNAYGPLTGYNGYHNYSGDS
jgi:hypothetical protein